MKLSLHSLWLFLALAASMMPSAAAAAQPAAQANLTKTPIRHFIVLMQENHTFDNYFGTYPGADGIPPGTRMPVDLEDPSAGYVEPYHIGSSSISDLSHSSSTFEEQYNNGAMNGFVSALNRRKQDGRVAMGYYNDSDLPYYWNLADQFVLFDRFFSSAKSGSFANHYFWVTGTAPAAETVRKPGQPYDEPLTIFDLLEERGISWKFYVQNYDPNITYLDLGSNGNRASQVVWVPLLNIDRFIGDPKYSSHIVDLSEYYQDLKQGTLPEVAYIAPSGASEHPPGSLATGQRFVKTLIQELMRSDAWDSSAFLLLYDDWGGWYDHVSPPQVDEFGYGMRVPALLVSPYARKGYIDSTTLDFTSVLKFIQENWGLPALAERDAKANSLTSAFDFSQPPRKPIFISSVRAKPDSVRAGVTRVIYSVYGTALLIALLAFGNAIFRHLRKSRYAREAS